MTFFHVLLPAFISLLFDSLYLILYYSACGVTVLLSLPPSLHPQAILPAIYVILLFNCILNFVFCKVKLKIVKVVDYIYV